MIKVGKAAKMLGVSIQTLHKWEATVETQYVASLLPDRKSKAGTRYYDAEKLLNLNNENELTIGYARVSSHDQKEDLTQQADLLETLFRCKRLVL